MSTAVINIRTQAQIKKQAQQVATDLGLSLSSLINGFLRQLVRSKQVLLTSGEQPSAYLLRSLRESEKDKKTGNISPAFDSVDSAQRWLDDSHKPYARQVHKKVR